jgi:hypothetical protein
MAAPREIYQPSGRVNWARLVPFLTLTSVLALLAGLALGAASRAGYHLVFLVPLVAAFFVGTMAWTAVVGARCRNPWLGAAIGLGLGAVALVGYLQFDLNPEAVGQSGHARQLAEGFCLGLAPLFFGWIRASRPFSEKAQRWLHEHVFSVDPEDAHEIVQALGEADVQLLADCVRPIPLQMMSKRGEVRLYYLPDEPTTPVYLTVRIVDGRPWTIGLPRRMATRVRLTAYEAAVLAERLRLPRARFGVLEVEPVLEESRPAAPAAAIEDLPAAKVGRARDRRILIVLTAVALTPLALALLIAAALGTYVALNWSDLGAGTRAGAAVVALAALFAAFHLTALYGDYLPLRIQRHLIAAAIERRATPLVRPDNPDAIYIAIVPRKNWGRMMLDNSTDVGLLTTDAERRLLLFEGTRQRWRIPADSIESCELDEHAIGVPDPKERNVFPVVVLRVSRVGGTWEAPLSAMRTTLRRPTAHEKRQRCRQLRKRIREILLESPQ